MSALDRPHCLDREACKAGSDPRYLHCCRCAQRARSNRERNGTARAVEIAVHLRDGRPASDLARVFGISRQRVEQIARNVPPIPDIPVPVWVSRAGLDEDYIDIARDSDEFAAAAHCRALKREMGAGL